MAIKRINEFPEGSGSLSNDDVFIFMDDPSGSGITKKISLSQISAAIGGGGGGGNPFDQDLNTTDSVMFDNIKLPNPLSENDTFTYAELSKTSLIIGQYIESSSEIAAHLDKDGLRLRNVDALLFDTDDMVYGFTGITFPDASFQNTAGVTSINPSGLSSFVKINNIVSCSQADYDSLGSPDTNTFYIITG